MGELQMIWTILNLAARDHDAASPLAKAVVKWARQQKKPLRLDADINAKRVSWRALSTIASHRAAVDGDAMPELFGLTDLVAKAVQLDTFNTRLIRVTAAAERLTLVADLSRLLMAA